MKKLCQFSAMLSLVVFAATAQANLLDDPSFEAATDNTQTSNSAWTLTADVPGAPNGGTEASAVFEDGPWAHNDGEIGVWFKSFEGNQAAGDTTANASLTQTVSNVAGGDYILTFDSARETNHTAGSTSVSLSDGSSTVSIDLLTATYNNGGNMNSDPTSFSLALPGVSAGADLTVLVEMVDGVDALANPQSIMFDNFSLVPEPTSLALAGISMLGLMGLRRKR